MDFGMDIEIIGPYWVVNCSNCSCCGGSRECQEAEFVGWGNIFYCTNFMIERGIRQAFGHKIPLLCSGHYYGHSDFLNVQLW